MENTSSTESRAHAMHADISNISVLSKRMQRYVKAETQELFERLRHDVDTAYLHLDVQPQKERTKGIQAYRWRALLITNRGRYYADDWSFGAIESLKQVLEKVEQQLQHRIGRLTQQQQELFA